MRKSLLLPIITSLLLCGCGNTSSTQESSISVPEYTEALYVSTMPICDYLQYDQLDLSDMTINERTYDGETLLSTKTITDYQLSWSKDEYTSCTDGMRLTKAGAFVINVSKEGCTSTKFTIYVDELDSGITQNLVINAYPKTSYKIGETFDADGLSASLVTTYKYNGKSKKKTETLSNYSMTINNQDASDYVFKDAKAVTLTISCPGWDDNVISNTISLSAIKEDSFDEKDTSEDTLMSEDKEKMKVTFTNNGRETEEGDKGYYSPDEIETGFTFNEFSACNVYDWVYTPSMGKVPFLIVPIITPGDEKKATDDNWNKIYKAFFGKSSDLYFESLRSYYYKSSFGQFDITGGMTGYFDPSEVNSKYSDLDYYTTDTIDKLPQMAAEWAAKNYGIDLKDYDSNHDGCIDGMWLINLHKTDSNQERFWGYTYSTFKKGTEEEPEANCYGWASVDFIDDTFNYSDSDNSECDAHVLIHETGHMLGLSDYYSYDFNSDYDALGQIDMMDRNTGDHNPYSKMMVGWIKPYIAYGSCTLEINSCQSNNSVIVIPYDDKEYKKNEDGKIIFNPFDEYLVLDYYTDKNINSYDYDIYDANHIKGDGGRLYHTDARTGTYDITAKMFSDPDDCMDGKNLVKPITNSNSGSQSEIMYGLSDMTQCDELRLIRADKVYSSYKNYADHNALFQTGDEFSISDYSSQFNDSALNCSHTLSSSFKINSIK